MTTMNTSSASTFLRDEIGGAVDADIVFLQELAVCADRVHSLRSSLRVRGWEAAISPAVRTAAGGMSSGTALFLRPHLARLEGFDMASPDGRFSSVAVQTSWANRKCAA